MLLKKKNLYYVCYIVDVIKKYKLVCYNLKVKNIYTYNFFQNQNFIKAYRS